MKSITLKADERLLASARARARRERTSLNELFRRWLAIYARKDRSPAEAAGVIRDAQQYARTGGRTFSRDEMNER